MTDIATFIDDTISRLQAPIDAYYDAQEGTGPLSAVRRGAAAVRTFPAFRDALTRAIDAAAVIGGDTNRAIRARLEAVKRAQVVYAIGFIDALPGLTRVQALARAASYVSAIVQVISDVRTDSLPELEIYPGDERLICTAWCKCTLRVVKLAGSGNYDVYWELHPAEHCEACLSMAAQWAPLPIRNGEITKETVFNWETSKMLQSIIALARSEAA